MQAGRQVETVDVMHLGREHVIAAHQLGGAVVDPGPSSCLETLLGGLDGEPEVLLLTHIHLDHAGATGSLVRRFPGLRVYVHEVGAPHLVDPSRLLASATRLYGAEGMERLWGEVAPVPAENIVALRGGEEVEGLRVAYTPGHASHHVSYFDPQSGDAYVGDVAGVRIPSADLTVLPTPPPDIDLEAWRQSLELIADWRPATLRLTHFGAIADVERQLGEAREGLGRYGELSRDLGRDRFIAAIEAEIDATDDPGAGAALRQAAPPEQLWLGLERYWRNRDRSA